MKAEKKKIKFEEALARIEEIARLLEEGGIGLEESLELFNEGIELSRFCTGKLEETKKKVEILARSVDGAMQVKKYEGGGENGE